jgi:hypothetical protein
MKKQIILCCATLALISTSAFFSSCSKTTTTTPITTNPSTTLDLNSWTVDGVLHKMSLYGSGWASTDFAPRFGIFEYSASNPTEECSMNFTQQPTKTGNYTIEQYTKVHLKQITGDFVGLIVRHNDKDYYSISTSGICALTVNGKDIVIVLKDAVLQEAGASNTIKVSAHMKCTWK